MYLYLGGLTGLVAILIHSITDFNLHIGANGLYFFFICAICVSAAHTKIRSGSSATLLKRTDIRWVKLSIFPVAILLVSSLTVNGGGFLANLHFNSILSVFQKDELVDQDHRQIIAHAQSAIKYDPFDSLYYTFFGDAKNSLGHEEAAFLYYKKALLLNPANGLYLQVLADYVSERGDKVTADRLYQAATQRDVKSSYRFANYAFWLLENNGKERGIEKMQHAISLSPRQTRRYLDLLVEEKLLDNEDLVRVLPERVEPHIIFAEYMAEKEQNDSADAAYKKALAYMDEETEVKSSFFTRVHRYYVKQKRYEDALAVIQTGITYLPENGRIRAIAGSLYEKLGINYRAIEEYKTALVFDPKNKQAKRRLKKLQ